MDEINFFLVKITTVLQLQRKTFTFLQTYLLKLIFVTTFNFFV